MKSQIKLTECVRLFSMRHNYLRTPKVLRRLESALDSACCLSFRREVKFRMRPDRREFYLHLAMLWTKVVVPYILNRGETLAWSLKTYVCHLSLVFPSIRPREKSVVQQVHRLGGRIAAVPRERRGAQHGRAHFCDISVLEVKGSSYKIIRQARPSLLSLID